MPEYELITYNDFSAGLWETENVWSIPEGGLTELVDAYPSASGELVPAPKFVELPTVGLASGRQVAGLFVNGQHYTPSGWPNTTPVVPRLLMATVTRPWTASGDLQIHYTDLNAENGIQDLYGNPNTFLTLQTHASATAPLASAAGIQYGPVSFQLYRNTALGLQGYYLVSDNFHGAAVAGIWKIGAPAGTSVSRVIASGTNVPDIFLLSHQDRLGGFEAGEQHIDFTEPGLDSAMADAMLVDSADPIMNLFGVPFFPDQLLVLRYPRGVYQISGNIEQPFIRQIDESFPINAYEWPAVTPYGLVYVSPLRGAALFTGEPPSQDISGPRFDQVPMIPAPTVGGQISEGGGGGGGGGGAGITATSLATKGSNKTQSSYSMNLGAAPPTNTLLLCDVTNRRGGGATTPTLSGAGVTWVQVATVTFESGARRVTRFRARASSTTAADIVADFAGTNQGLCTMALMRVDGADGSGTNGSGAIVQSPTNLDDVGSTNMLVNLAAFGQTNNAVIATFATDNDTVTVTKEAGWTDVYTASSDAPDSRLFGEYLGEPDTTATATLSSARQWAGIATEIKNAEAAAGAGAASGTIPDSADSIGIQNLGLPFLGQLAYGGEFVFTPHGYVYDFRTEAWFKVTLPPLGDAHNYLFWTYDKFHEVVFAAGSPTSTAPKLIAAQVGTSDVSPYPAGADTYHFKTAPLPVGQRQNEVVETHIKLSRTGPAVIVDITVEGDGDDAPSTHTRRGPQSPVMKFKTPMTARRVTVEVRVSDQSGERAPAFQEVSFAVLDRQLIEPEEKR